MNPTILPTILSPEEVRDLLHRDTDVRIIDVRTPGEFDAVHIPGSYNIPLATLNEHAEALARHLVEPVVLVCRTGVRARHAEAALGRTGAYNLHLLDGGMVAWESAGGDVRRETGAARKWALERQVRLVAGSIALLGALGALAGIPGLIWLPILIGGGLTFSALTDTCAMGSLLARLPYNQTRTCDINEIVGQLAQRRTPAAG